MNALKKLVLGTIIGLSAGIWIGVNIGHNQALFSNPFPPPTLHGTLKPGEHMLLNKAKALGGKN